jgi:Rad3-related DNA helicase
VVRGVLSFEITDYHLSSAVRLLRAIDAPEAEQLQGFLDSLIRIVRSKRPGRPTLLDDGEIRELVDILLRIDGPALRRRVEATVTSGEIDTREHREVLTRVERLVYDLGRYLYSFEYSLETEDRRPLNYTYAYFTSEQGESGRVENRLVVKAYYVAPLIQRRLLSGNMTLAYSATIGDPDILRFETGIAAPFYAFPSDFPVENTRVFLPTDTPNLAMRARRRGDLARTLRRIARACRRFADKGIRSLVIVVSEVERTRFLQICLEEEVEAVSYGDGVSARQAAERFRNGRGEVLVGTVANYGEGVDLPRRLAPVIFFLRPGYPRPDDPATQFEERRFRGQRRWALWNWRVMLEALQVRGRNVRGTTDLGVTFFISQQFRRFLFASLPRWLQGAYCGDKTFNHCVEEAEEMLLGQNATFALT